METEFDTFKAFQESVISSFDEIFQEGRCPGFFFDPPERDRADAHTVREVGLELTHRLVQPESTDDQRDAITAAAQQYPGYCMAYISEVVCTKKNPDAKANVFVVGHFAFTDQYQQYVWHIDDSQHKRTIAGPPCREEDFKLIHDEFGCLRAGIRDITPIRCACAAPISGILGEFTPSNYSAN